jgi:hypothetical protein
MNLWTMTRGMVLSSKEVGILSDLCKDVTRFQTHGQIVSALNIPETKIKIL